MRHVPLLLAACLAIIPFAAEADAAQNDAQSGIINASPSGGNLVGTLPDKARASEEVARRAKAGSEKVKAGETHTNGDGLKVTTDSDSKGKATVWPKDGSETSASTVNTSSGWKGSIEGMDSIDTINLGSSSDATISGDGGAVVMGSGSATVTNNGAAGGPSIHVTKADGSVVDVAPGTSQTF